MEGTGETSTFPFLLHRHAAFIQCRRISHVSLNGFAIITAKQGKRSEATPRGHDEAH